MSDERRHRFPDLQEFSEAFENMVDRLEVTKEHIREESKLDTYNWLKKQWHQMDQARRSIHLASLATEHYFNRTKEKHDAGELLLPAPEHIAQLYDLISRTPGLEPKDEPPYVLFYAIGFVRYHASEPNAFDMQQEIMLRKYGTQ